MSWMPFRKAPKKATSDLVSDNDFDREVQTFNDVEASTRKTYKDCKRYIEDNVNVVKSQQRIGQDLIATSANISSDDQLHATAEMVYQVTQKQADLYSELNSNLRRTFVEPLKKFSANFNTVNSAIKRREQSLQDYARYLNKREKYMEKGTLQQSGKFDANERYLTLAKADFERRNTKLLEELPKFYESRSAYFAPCYEALVKSQIQFYKDSRDLFEELSVKVECPTEQWSDEQYAAEISNRLSDIKSLSIVAGR